MLERLSLVVGMLHPDVGRPYRPIQDGDSGQLLGHAIRAPATNWLDWFGRRTEAVCEVPDGSLLCMVHRDWWLGETTLHDSENQLIASLRRRHLLWPDDRLIAELSKTVLANQMVFQNEQKVELATLQCEGDQRRLTFHPRVADEPFIKMALLAATLDL